MYDDAVRHVRQALAASGVPLDLGVSLWQIFVAAGLGVPQMLTHLRVEPAPAAETSRYLAETARTLAPELTESGRSMLAQGRGVSLEERLMRELSARRATTVSPLAIGVWARKPPAVEEDL